MAPLTRAVHRVEFPLTADRTDLKLPGFRRALHAGPSRAFSMGVELWYEVDLDYISVVVDVTVHIEGTGHPIRHNGRHLTTYIAVGVWHVYIETALESEAIGRG